MKHTPLEQNIADLLTPTAQDMGLEILYVTVTGDSGAKQVQITAEDPKTGRLSVDKCASLSREASTLMDVEDLIKDAYRLEISSPGIDRLLLRKKDFETYAGFDTKLETHTPSDAGQKRFRGVLKGITASNDIEILTDQGPEFIAFDDVKKAKLVLTDDLIKATAKQ